MIEINSPLVALERVDAAAMALAAGHSILLVDERIGQGAIVYSAARATVTNTAFAVEHSSGFLCVALDDSNCRRLDLTAMAGTPFEDTTSMVVTVDVRAGTTTGISAADRASTLRALADPESRADDFTRPGHVVPVRVPSGRRGERQSLPGAALDLATLAGHVGAAYADLVSIENPVEMAGYRECVLFAERHSMRWVTIDDMTTHVYMRTDELIAEPVRRINTPHGSFDVVDFRDSGTGLTHSVLTPSSGASTTDSSSVRVLRNCDDGGTFGSTACGCADELDAALARLTADRSGVLLYLRGADPHAGTAADFLPPPICSRIIPRLGLVSFGAAVVGG